MHIKRNLALLNLTYVPKAEVEIPADSLLLGIGKGHPLDLILACPEGAQPVKRTVWIVALGEEIPPSAQAAILSGFVGVTSVEVQGYAFARTAVVIIENQEEAVVRSQHRRKL